MLTNVFHFFNNEVYTVSTNFFADPSGPAPRPQRSGSNQIRQNRSDPDP